MNTYGWLLMGQTLLALVVLGLCGGWVLWPFRRAERPYLWLAAPLAGVFAFGGVLAALYFLAGLPFRACFWGAIVANGLATAACLMRGRAGLPTLSNRTVATVVILGVAYWATLSCNKTAIDSREPTLTAMDGSDMFGYALIADWLRTHPAATRPREHAPYESLAFHNLRREGSRPVTFLLLAAASEARGMSALFSYDWWSGVLLAAAMLGFAGVFAPSSLLLVLLAGGVGASNWLTTARTGFMGKLVAYPGGLLLMGLALAAVERPTRWRLAVLLALLPVLAFSLSPTFPPPMLALVLGGFVVACLARYLVQFVLRQPEGFWPSVGRPIACSALVFAAALPVYHLHRKLYGEFPGPPPPKEWVWVIPAALDLEKPTLRELTDRTRVRLLEVCAGALGAALLLAVWQRNRAAAALLGSALIVPLCWALGEYRLYLLHGLIYPLTLAGAAALVDPSGRRRIGDPPAPAGPPVPEPAASGWRWPSVRTAARVGLVTALVLVMIGLRVPQIRSATQRYLYSAQPHRVVHRLSEARALRTLVGPDGVDVSLGHWADNHLAWAELATQGVPVRFRSPGWERSVGAYAGGNPDYDLFAPKARFSLLERTAWCEPGTERWVGRRLKLVEDRGGVAVLGITDAQGTSWDAEWRPGVWIGNKPTLMLIHNGTGAPRSVVLRGDTAVGPALQDPTRRTLVYRLGEASGSLPLPGQNKAALPLELAPGLNRLELSVAEPADPPPPPGHPVLLLEFRNWRFEPADASPRTAGP